MQQIIFYGELERISKEKESENAAFVSLLKEKRLDIDEQTHRLAQHYESEIDCTICGNCCAKLHPGVSERDLPNLSVATGMTGEDAAKEYLIRDDDAGAWYIKKSPCSFLKEKKCSIYENRPESCADFPHLMQPYARLRIKRIMANYEICPIVYHTIEDLKKEILKD